MRKYSRVSVDLEDCLSPPILSYAIKPQVKKNIFDINYSKKLSNVAMSLFSNYHSLSFIYYAYIIKKKASYVTRMSHFSQCLNVTTLLVNTINRNDIDSTIVTTFHYKF